MILSILKSYLPLLLFIGLGSLLIFIMGLCLILKPRKLQNTAKYDHEELHHMNAIAGDDVITTQLDLARAYIETGRKQLAVQILDYVIEHGNPDQQQEAKQLKKFR
jgi:FimV-like protein